MDHLLVSYPSKLFPPFFLKNHLSKTLSKGGYLIKASNGKEIYSEKLMIE
jgi:hypothetical protein